MSHLDRLIKKASGPIGLPLGDSRRQLRFIGDSSSLQLESLLQRCNGFYAFESALHVFPSGEGHSELSLEEWNEPTCWKREFGNGLDSILCFAEDVFGNQFCFAEGEVAHLDPETGELEPVAPDLESWAAVILDDFAFRTGHPLAHSWQQQNRPIQPGERLLPKIPFVLGGEFSVESLVAVDALKGMQYRGDIARQIRNLPDGGQVRLSPLEAS